MGVAGIRAIRKIWGGYLVADLKTADGLLGEVDRVLISAAGGVGLKEARSIVVDDLVQPGDSWMGIPTDSDVEAMAQQFLATIE